MISPERAQELNNAMRKTFVDLTKGLFRIGQGDEQWVRGITEKWIGEGKQAFAREGNVGSDWHGLRQQFGSPQNANNHGLLTIDEVYALLTGPHAFEPETAQRIDQVFFRLFEGLFIAVKGDEKVMRDVIEDDIKRAIGRYIADALSEGIEKQTEEMEAENRRKEEFLRKMKAAMGETDQ